MEGGVVIFEQIGALLVAILLGALVGWERFTDRKPAGLRTHTLVSLGATAFMLSAREYLGDHGFTDAEMSRVAQGVITGIGFLGAGAIFRTGSHVSGLTTAATIWMAASIGIAVGVGAWGLAVVITLLTWVVLRGFRVIEVWYGGKEPRRARTGESSPPAAVRQAHDED
jgi:putative Mg2+ transporter-C (MgtC) family protein